MGISMDIRSHFHEKVKLSINQMSDGEKAAEKARLNAVKIADEATAMVLNAAGQLSREIAQYKSEISFKRRHDKINNDIIISPKYYQPLEGREPYLYINLSRIHSVEDAERNINSMMQWCAEHVAYSRSERVQAQRRRGRISAIFFGTIFGLPVMVVLYLLLR
jgi:hypothetical protein